MDNKFILNDFIIIKSDNKYSLFGYQNSKELKYIHEVQNVFHSLNKKELYI
jgi:hypothetical protein